MDCPSCFTTFVEGEVDPHILIGCGHSICMDCIKSKANNSSDDTSTKIEITCPECGKETLADNISWLPKNMALLNMVKS